MMYKNLFNKQAPLHFRQFTGKGYALFSALGKEVLICTLSVATLSHARAEGISVRPLVAIDSVGQSHRQIDEVVISGLRAPLTMRETAKVVAVITRNDINRVQASSISDLLKTVPGVDVRQRGGFGVQTDISINGGTFDQLSILLNGMPLNNPQTGHNAADFPVALEDIERIEILEGAASRVLGASAFSGAINIVTKADKRTGVRLTAQGGSYGTFDVGMGLTFRNQQTNHQLSGGYTQSDGGTLHSDFSQRRGFYQGGYDWKNIQLTWQAGLSAKNYGANTFYSPKSNDQYEETRRILASVRADIKLFNNTFLITPMIYGHRNYDQYQFYRGKTGANMGENLHRTDVYGAMLNAMYTWVAGRTSIGVDIEKEHIVSTAYGELMPESRWMDIHGSDRKYDKVAHRNNESIFLEHTWNNRHWTVSAGVMANHNNWFGNKLNFYPGVDVAFRPDNHWNVFASWNKALRLPTFTDLYISNRAQQGDKNLKAEQTTTTKLGTTYRTKGWEATASLFYAAGRNMIDWVYETAESERYHALNIGKLDNMGGSATVTWYVNETWKQDWLQRIDLGYAYINQNHKTEQPIYKSLYALEYLKHKFTANIAHRIYKQLEANWTVRWQQRMNGYEPYTKIDVKLQWSKPKYQIFVKADNITAHRYYDLGSVLQPGLWIMAGATLRLP